MRSAFAYDKTGTVSRESALGNTLAICVTRQYPENKNYPLLRVIVNKAESSVSPSPLPQQRAISCDLKDMRFQS